MVHRLAAHLAGGDECGERSPGLLTTGIARTIPLALLIEFGCIPYTDAEWEKLSIFLNFLVPKQDAVQREDGSWLLAGWKPADDMAELLKLALPARRNYHTVAGFTLVRLGRFPRLGDTFEFGSWRFEVIDIDRRRIDKVLAQPLRKPVIAL